MPNASPSGAALTFPVEGAREDQLRIQGEAVSLSEFLCAAGEIPCF